MKKKKMVAIVAAAALLGSFILFLLGRTSYLVFMATAAITAIIAYRMLPKMKE